MLKSLRKPVKRSNGGSGTNGHNGHSGSNGSNGHGANGYGTAAPRSAIEVPDSFLWSLEVRHDQRLLGAMHSANPFLLISFFSQYSILYGEPVESYAVWLRHRASDRGAPLQPLFSEDAWLDFLRQLDPELDDRLETMRAAVDRTSMIAPDGHQTYPDAVLEPAFGLD